MSDDYIEYSDASISSGRPKGPLGVDPLHFSAALFSLLLFFVLYLLLPRGFRVHYFRGYPKRYAWSARSRAARGRRSNGLHTLGHQVSGNEQSIKAALMSSLVRLKYFALFSTQWADIFVGLFRTYRIPASSSSFNRRKLNY